MRRKQVLSREVLQKRYDTQKEKIKDGLRERNNLKRKLEVRENDLREERAERARLEQINEAYHRHHASLETSVQESTKKLKYLDVTKAELRDVLSSERKLSLERKKSLTHVRRVLSEERKRHKEEISVRDRTERNLLRELQRLEAMPKEVRESRAEREYRRKVRITEDILRSEADELRRTLDETREELEASRIAETIARERLKYQMSKAYQHLNSGEHSIA